MRTIDADALFKDICDSINEMTKIEIAVDGEWLWAKLNDALENAPTIEPERKKGKWISLDDYRGKYNECGFKCSECGGHSDYEECFCHDCGADMEENL